LGLRSWVLARLREVRGKWGLAPWLKPVWYNEKRHGHGACPHFPDVTFWKLFQDGSVATGRNAHPTAAVGWAFLPDGGYRGF